MISNSMDAYPAYFRRSYGIPLLPKLKAMVTYSTLSELRISKLEKRKIYPSTACSTPSVRTISVSPAPQLLTSRHAGHEPATELVRSQLNVDSDGYIITKPGTTETNVDGVFAAGDVQDKKYRQAITSAGSGTFTRLDFEQALI